MGRKKSRFYKNLPTLDRNDTNGFVVDPAVSETKPPDSNRSSSITFSPKSVINSRKKRQMEKYIAKKLKKDERPNLLTRLTQSSFKSEEFQSSKALLVPSKRAGKTLKEAPKEDNPITEDEQVQTSQAILSKTTVVLDTPIDILKTISFIKKSPLNPLERTKVESSSESESIEDGGQNDVIPSVSLDAPLLPNHETFFVLVQRKEDIEEQRIKLPICAEEQNIMEKILGSPVTIICGETGSGKTTQVPQFLYEAGFGDSQSLNPGLIGITQPRRVAAISMAGRVGEELDKPSQVAYQIRYESTVSDDTRIKFMTDGILLRELADDFLLKQYSVILLDEAHERNLNTDILIGMLSRVVRERNRMALANSEIKPLRIVVMSATLNIDEFMTPHLFTPSPSLIKVDARQHPVTIHFSKRTNPDYVASAFQMIQKIHASLPPGGILVFMTGKQEILKLINKLLKKRRRWDEDQVDEEGEWDENSSFDEESEDCLPGEGGSEAEKVGEDEFDLDLVKRTNDPLHVLPLYSLLAPEEQLKVFQPPPEGHRLCIIATNVAETSITIPNIRYVVDSGRVKQRHYDSSTGTSQYQIEWCSKASATQRAGRAGRIGPGHCYRLYSSPVFDQQFPEHAVPEIQRSSIDGLVLQLKTMSIDKPENFPLPSSPPLDAIKDAQTTLESLKALVKANSPNEFRITALGRKMAALPLTPRWARLVIMAMELRRAQSIAITLASVLSVGDPFLDRANEINEDSPSLKQTQLDLAGKPNQGDLMMWLSALVKYCMISPRNRRAFCRQHHLMPKRMIEMHQQMNLLYKNLHSNYKYPRTEYGMVLETQDLIFLRRLIAESLPDRGAERIKRVIAPDGKRINLPTYRLLSRPIDDPTAIAYLHPSSVMINGPPPFLVYTELILVQNVSYLKYVTPIESGWLK